MIRITRISAVSVLLALLFSTGAMAQSSAQPSAREANGGERANLDSGTAQNPASTMQKDTANKRIKKVNAKAELKVKKAKAKSGDMSTSPPTDMK